MAKRHWLDPLARRILNATAQLGDVPPAKPLPERRANAAPSRGAEASSASVSRRGARLVLDLGLNQVARLSERRGLGRSGARGWQLDVNRATAAEWQQLPGCTAIQVDLLLRLQRGGVQLSGLEDLQRLLNLDADTLEVWRPMLVFRWYDGPPVLQTPALVPLNQASSAMLQDHLGLSPDRCVRLLRERSRAPFLDLADLQLRLQFPPEVIEAMIGKVDFTAAEPGPCLPPGQPANGARLPFDEQPTRTAFGDPGPNSPRQNSLRERVERQASQSQGSERQRSEQNTLQRKKMEQGDSSAKISSEPISSRAISSEPISSEKIIQRPRIELGKIERRGRDQMGAQQNALERSEPKRPDERHGPKLPLTKG